MSRQQKYVKLWGRQTTMYGKVIEIQLKTTIFSILWWKRVAHLKNRGQRMQFNISLYPWILLPSWTGSCRMRLVVWDNGISWNTSKGEWKLPYTYSYLIPAAKRQLVQGWYFVDQSSSSFGSKHSHSNHEVNHQAEPNDDTYSDGTLDISTSLGIFYSQVNRVNFIKSIRQYPCGLFKSPFDCLRVRRLALKFLPQILSLGFTFASAA